MRIWFKVVKDNHILSDLVITRDEEDTRTHKIFGAIDDACMAFDLQHPIWLDNNIAEFKRYAKVRFNQDNYIEEIYFDYFELEVLDED